MKDSGVLALPHKNTLRNYASFTNKDSGFNSDIVNRLKARLEAEGSSSSKYRVSIVFDEVRVKDGLVYSTADGSLIGFCNLGDINDQLQDLRDQDEQEPPLATHVIVFMMRGIFSDY